MIEVTAATVRRAATGAIVVTGVVIAVSVRRGASARCARKSPLHCRRNNSSSNSNRRGLLRTRRL